MIPAMNWHYGTRTILTGHQRGWKLFDRFHMETDDFLHLPPTWELLSPVCLMALEFFRYRLCHDAVHLDGCGGGLIGFQPGDGCFCCLDHPIYCQIGRNLASVDDNIKSMGHVPSRPVKFLNESHPYFVILFYRCCCLLK